MSAWEEKLIRRYLDAFDIKMTRWMASYGIRTLEIGLGIIFVWFGMVKFFPGLSPEEPLVTKTIDFIEPHLILPFLAGWETVIGLGLILNRFKRLTLLMLFFQMGGTILPLIALPDVVWNRFPYALTLEGQYILKNIIVIASGLVIGATVRGGRITTG